MDNSFNHTQPMDFVLGGQPMIKGFEEGLKMLREGSKAKLFIPSSMGYANNAPPEIGANANLVFDIEVLKVSDQAPPTNNQAPPTIDTTRR
jgi:FKBP-type peptidyl-prolyl cis-trans isomerase FkpA/FKBP-type peptidyl-prolyl cis-trans isomerase FklB